MDRRQLVVLCQQASSYHFETSRAQYIGDVGVGNVLPPAPLPVRNTLAQAKTSRQAQE